MTPPSISFKPSPESTDLRVYKSPLVDRDGGGKKVAYDPVRSSIQNKRQQRSCTEMTGPEEMRAYVIDDSSSMEDVISELNK